MTRREAAELVFDYIRNNGFTPYNIKYGNGYFIFEMGEDSVCHFQIKGLHGWKFAMWLETDYDKLKNQKQGGGDYPAIQFFCQHKTNIDKFKPSRSHFVVNYTYQDLCNMQSDSCMLYEIREMLQMIKRHPLISFTMDGVGTQYYEKSYIVYNLKHRSWDVKYQFAKWFRDFKTTMFHKYKVWFIQQYKVVDTVQFVDNNHDGFVCSPRYDMKIHFKKLFEDEEEQCAAEVRMLDFWFHKNYYNNMHLELTREGIERPYSYEMEGV